MKNADYKSLTGKLFVPFDQSIFQEGVAHFTEHMLFKKLMSNSYNMESLGIKIYANTTNEFIYFDFQTITKNAALAVKTLLDMIFYYDINDYDLEFERKVILEELAFLESNPDYNIRKKIHKMLWEEDNGFSVIGSKENILDISRENIVDFLKFNINNVFLSLYGNANFEEITDLLEKYILHPIVPQTLQDISKKYTENVNDINLDNEVINTCIGYRIENWREHERWIFDLINTFIGEGLSGQLNKFIRDKKSLVYEIWSDCNFFKTDLQFLIGFTCTSKNTEKTIKAIQELVENIEINEVDFFKTKQKFLSELIFSFDDADSHTFIIGRYFLQSGEILTFDSIEKKINDINITTFNRILKKIFGQKMKIVHN